VSAGTSPFSTRTSPCAPASAARRGAHGVARAERRLLHGHLDAVEETGGVGRGHDDDPVDAGVARGVDHPVDHPAPEQGMEVLRRRALHARAEAAGQYDCCEIVRHV